MGNFVNRDTFQRIRSGNDPDFSDPPWLPVPPGSANEGVLDSVEAHYLEIAGDVLSEMSAGEKAAVDAAALELSRDSETAELDRLESVLRQLFLVLIDELNNQHSARINAILAAAANATNLSSFKSDMALITDAPTRTPAQLRAVIRAGLGS